MFKETYMLVFLSAGQEVVRITEESCHIGSSIVFPRRHPSRSLDLDLTEYRTGEPPPRGYAVRILVKVEDQEKGISFDYSQIERKRITIRGVTPYGEGGELVVDAALACDWSSVDVGELDRTLIGMDSEARALLLAMMHAAVVFQRPQLMSKYIPFDVRVRGDRTEYAAFLDCVSADIGCGTAAAAMFLLHEPPHVSAPYTP